VAQIRIANGPSPADVNRRISGALSRLACWSLIACGTAGCSAWDNGAAAPGYLPDWSEARLALESALTAWRDAPSPLPQSLDTPAVKFVDKQRRPGERLLSFAILGQTDAETARQFTVRLQVDGGEPPRLVRYNVLGRNPYWVFRLEDFEMIAHWEHDMSEPAPGEPTAAQPATGAGGAAGGPPR
jgi:hypothetical protein